MLDTKRTGYDNLFLVGGYDWQAKMSAVLNGNYEALELKVKTLTTNFEKLDKKDVVNIAKWENEVLHACGMKGKPLPVVTTPAPKPVPVKPANAPEPKA
jgi:hypothetical protein